MRIFEWITVAVVAVITWYWFRGRRAPSAVAWVGALAVAASVLLEKPRAVMVPAYLVVTIALLMALRRPAVAETPKGGWLRHVGRGALAVIVLLLAVALPWLWPVMKLPTPTGPHPIGTMWLVVRDTSRAERFSGSRDTPREFPVQVWYPAAEGATGPRARYATPEEMTFFGLLPRMLAAQVTLVRTHAIVDAPMAPGRAPVLIFSHGYASYGAQNTPQMEELASRGYVVASIVHTGETAAAAFPDGRRVPMDSSVMAVLRKEMDKAQNSGADPQKMMDSVTGALSVADPVLRQSRFREFLQQTVEPLRSESVREWAFDTRALVEELEAIDAGTVPSPFQGRLDLEHLGVFGMSYGGATAGEFCRQDARCRAAINMDGGQYGGLIDDSLTVPLLIIGSEQAYGVHVPVLDLARGPAWLIKVPATTHLGLTDLTLQGPLLRWSGVTGRLDPARREAIMTGFILGFFEKYLMNRHPELFDSLPAKFPEVEITSRNVR